jgi:hypothetical protein
VIDHLIKNAKLFYRSWKYWHSPMLHGKGMVVAIAYDMYLECAEGNLNPDWKLAKPVDYWTFRERLSDKMLGYKPENRQYPGDQFMRATTKLSKKQKNKRSTNHSLSSAQGAFAGVDKVTFESASAQIDSEPIRLCGDLSDFTRHAESVIHGMKNPRNCKWCGIACHQMCGLCKKALHYMPNKGNSAGKICFVKYHNEMCFGLAKDDFRIVSKRKADWIEPDAGEVKANADHIKGLKGLRPDNSDTV